METEGVEPDEQMFYLECRGLAFADQDTCGLLDTNDLLLDARAPPLIAMLLTMLRSYRGVPGRRLTILSFLGVGYGRRLKFSHVNRSFRICYRVRLP